MKERVLHTPDGVRDLYNGECQRKLKLQNQLHEVLLKYGYHDIQTPTFEFFDIFGSEIGTIPSKDLYKFFDKEGNTLVLRPDFTPAIARSAAKYFTNEDLPVRLCYMGNTFINSSDYQGRLKETTQCGAELIGDSSISADAEVLSLVVDSLLVSGLKEFKISVGHAKLFRELVIAANISEELESELREYLLNKNFLGVEEIVASLGLEANLNKLFALMYNFDTTDADLMDAIFAAKEYPSIKKAIEELLELKNYLCIYNIDDYITFELGIISEYQYYTGIIFAGYTFGTGEAVVKGGRYDHLLHHYGKNEPAIGFAIVVDQLMAALLRQHIEIDVSTKRTVIVFDESSRTDAIMKAMSLRNSGEIVETLQKAEDKKRPDYEEYANKTQNTTLLYMAGE